MIEICHLASLTDWKGVPIKKVQRPGVKELAAQLNKKSIR